MAEQFAVNEKVPGSNPGRGASKTSSTINMELSEFITKVLVEVTTGIKNANSSIGEGTFEMEAFRRDGETGFISFDLAVKTSESKGNGANGGIQVLNIGIGGKISKDSSHEQQNRVKFYVMPGKNIK